MKPIFNKILVMLLAIIIASIVISILEGLNTKIFPIDPSIDMSDFESIKKNIDKIGVGNKLIVLMAHGIGTLFGGIIIGWIYAGNKHKGALILGGIFTFFGLVNIILIPHPIWMVIADLCIYIPMAVIGKNLGLRLT